MADTKVKPPPQVSQADLTKALSYVRGLSLADAAQHYAALGIPVHPLRQGSKLPLTRHGFQDATTDPHQIADWWRRFEFNIGLRCGVAFDVLDVDVKDGAPGLESLSRALWSLSGAFGCARTPSGGFHYLYEPSPALRATSLRGYGLDVRGTDSYIVAAPSRLPDGVYEWLPWSPPKNPTTLPWDAIRRAVIPPAPAPEVAPSPQTIDHQGAEPLVRWLGKQKPGNRNQALFYAANRLLERGLDPFVELTDTALSIGLPEPEVRSTIASAVKGASL